MQPVDLVFWIDHLTPLNTDRGVLCKHHADSMVVPRGWTLNDLREPHLRLFRPPSVESADARPRRRPRPSAVGDDTQQLELTVDAASALADAAPSREAEWPPPREQSPRVEQSPPPAQPAHRERSPQRWAPQFDESDDLDGMLAARSPLLHRAFRGGERPR
jgi:hypothetical protein